MVRVPMKAYFLSGVQTPNFSFYSHNGKRASGREL
jgi:hypothetical protein